MFKGFGVFLTNDSALFVEGEAPLVYLQQEKR